MALPCGSGFAHFAHAHSRMPATGWYSATEGATIPNAQKEFDMKKNLLFSIITALFLFSLSAQEFNPLSPVRLGPVEPAQYDVYVIGDGSGVTHSLSHASASGVHVAHMILNG